MKEEETIACVSSPVKMEKQIININIPNDAEKTTYQISLDDLDMSLLPMNRMSREYLKTLNQVDDDLCAFILYAEEHKSNKHAIKNGAINEGASTSSQTLSCTDTTETYQCHICKLSIFKVHKKDHNSSEKHKTMLALAKHGLDRINKHLSQEDDDTEKETSSSNYCQPCNIRVEPKDISSHFDSDLHIISMKKDKLMSNLLKLYMASVPSPTMDGTEKMNVQKLNNASKEHEQVDNKLSNYHVCEICQVKVVHNAHDLLQHNSGIKHIKNKIKQDNLAASLANFKEKSQPKVQAMSKQKCGNLVQKEETEMFRAVIRDNNGTKKITYKCDVCKIYLNSEICLRDHINGNQHKLVIESLKKSKIKTNENVTPTVKPPKSNAKPNPAKTNNVKTSVSTSYHCATCNVMVPNNSENILDHLNGKRHLDNEAEQRRIQELKLLEIISRMKF